MSKRRPLPDPDRRKFLKGATLAGCDGVTSRAVLDEGVDGAHHSADEQREIRHRAH